MAGLDIADMALPRAWTVILINSGIGVNGERGIIALFGSVARWFSPEFPVVEVLQKPVRGVIPD
jgi:hypothetical protein